MAKLWGWQWHPDNLMAEGKGLVGCINLADEMETQSIRMRSLTQKKKANVFPYQQPGVYYSPCLVRI